MSITTEQVADLRRGDIVRITSSEWPDGAAVEGPLTVGEHDGAGLVLNHPHIAGAYWVRTESGEPYDREARTLTVVSRAPRPLYVNSDRTEPVTGDVVGDAEPGHPRNVWLVNADDADRTWFVNSMTEWLPRSHLPTRLRLLVDGTTGTAVTS